MESSAGRSQSPGTKPRSAAIFCLPPAARRVSPFTSRSARICGCRSRRAPLQRSPEPRSSSISPPATSRSARRKCAACCAPRNRRAASRPMPIPPPVPANRRPISPGTAKPASSNAATGSPRPSVFRHSPKSRLPMSMSDASARSGCGPTPSAIVCAPPATNERRFARSASISRHRANRSSCAVKSSASRMCRRTRRCCARTATKPTTSRFRDWRSGLRRRG